MADNFNLSQFVRNNRLLNENIGGYVDIQPMREEMGTAMERDEDFGYAKHSGDFSGDDSETEDFGTTDDRIMGLGGDRLLAIVRKLTKEGFYLDDIVRFLVGNLK